MKKLAGWLQITERAVLERAKVRGIIPVETHPRFLFSSDQAVMISQPYPPTSYIAPDGSQKTRTNQAARDRNFSERYGRDLVYRRVVSGITTDVGSSRVSYIDDEAFDDWIERHDSDADVGGYIG